MATSRSLVQSQLGRPEAKKHRCPSPWNNLGKIYIRAATDRAAGMISWVDAQVPDVPVVE